jgi:Ca2+-binding RTX toxin-like protein
VTQGAHGTVSIAANGDLIYTPDNNYLGADSFDYVVSDGHGGTDTGTVSVTVDEADEAGLLARYFVFSSWGETFSTIDFDAMPDHMNVVSKVDHTSSSAFYSGGPTDLFAASYEGVLDITESGEYTFSLRSDDGSELWIDGVRVIDNGGYHSDNTETYTAFIGAGEHDIEVRYFEGYADQIIQLSYAGPDTDDEDVIIDGTALTHSEEGIVFGTSGGDNLTGTADDDDVYGLAGADTLYGADGLDMLFGGAGADTFVFETATAFSDIDVISDFSTAQSDKLDLSGLLGQYDPLTELITDFVQITTSGSNSVVKVDMDGGANGFVQIATITGVTGLTDEAALVTNGTLIAA